MHVHVFSLIRKTNTYGDPTDINSTIDFPLLIVTCLTTCIMPYKSVITLVACKAFNSVLSTIATQVNY